MFGSVHGSLKNIKHQLPVLLFFLFRNINVKKRAIARNVNALLSVLYES